MTNSSYTITAADRLGAYSSHPTLADALTTLEQLKQSLDFDHHYIEERAEDDDGYIITRKIYVDWTDWERDDSDFESMSIVEQRRFLDDAWRGLGRNLSLRHGG